jgi:hypothetical protein
VKIRDDIAMARVAGPIAGPRATRASGRSLLPLRSAALLLAAFLLSLAFAPSAHAASKTKLGEITAAASAAANGAGQLFNPSGAGVNRTGAGGVSAGDFYVVDRGNNRISQFSANGTFVRSWGFDVIPVGGTGDTGTGLEVCTTASTCKAGVASAAAGALRVPLGLAIDPNTGNVFVYGNENKRIDVYSAQGEFQGAFGWNVVSGGAAGTGTLASGSTSVTSVVTTSKAFVVGQKISGAGIPAGTTIAAVGANTNTITLSQASIASEAGVALSADVGAGNVAQNELQTVTIGGAPTGGSFTLTFKDPKPSEASSTTAAIPFDAGAAEVQAQLEALSNVGVGNVEVTGPAGGPYAIEFKGGRYSDTNVNELTASGAELTPSGTVTVATPRDGGALELCTEASGCLAGEASGSAGGIANAATGSAQHTRNLAVDTSGNVYLPDPGNLRVDVFTPTLNGSDEVTGISFARAFGWKVNAAAPAEALQQCTNATGCQKGSAGNGAGQFLTEGLIGITVDGAGSIFALNAPANCSATETCRVERFNADGTLSDDQFGPAVGEQCSLTTVSGTTAAGGIVAIAADTSTGHIYGLKKFSTTTARVCELTNSGEELPEGSLFPGQNLSVAAAIRAGLAVGPGERVWAVNAAPAIHILGPVPPPSAAILPTQGIGQRTATLHGEVTVPAPGGEGFDTKYHFEYSADGGFSWKSAPIPDASAGSVAGTVPVSQAIAGLQPNRNYLVRLVATTSSSVTSTNGQFTTLPDKPSVAGSEALPVGGTTATLNGTVNPNNSSTTYKFEWGETTAYGNRAPDFDPFVGAGGDAVAVSAKLAGLKPSTTYHFRLVATNAFGTTTGPDSTFTTNAGDGLNPSGLPDNRAIELVSPADKRPAGNVYRFNLIQVYFQAAEDGEAIAYPIFNALGDSAGGGETIFMGARSGAGWSATQLTPPSLIPAPAPEGTSSALPGRVRYIDRKDFKCSVIESFNPLTADTPQVDVENGVTNLYRRDRATGGYTLITNRVPLNPGISVSEKFYELAGASADCSRIFFSTVFGGYSFFAGDSSLYEWHDGVLRDAGQLPDGTLSPVAGQGLEKMENTVAPSGRTFFTAVSNEGADSGRAAVFVRDGAATAAGTGDTAAASTVVDNLSTSSGSFAVGQTITGAGIPSGTRIAALGADSVTLSKAATATATGVALKASQVIDASQSATGSTSLGAQYETASPDGSHVFFLANYGLTADSSSGPKEDCSQISKGSELGNVACDLYDYDVETGELTNISADPNGADPRGAVAIGVMDVSEDGSTVYFAARGQLVPGEGNTYAENLQAPGSANVYRWRDGTLTYIAELTAKDVDARQTQNRQGALVHYPNNWVSQTTKSGDYFLFVSRANITGTNPKGVPQGYLFSGQSESLSCVSCPPDGSEPLPEGKQNLLLGSFGPEVIARPQEGSIYAPSSLSEDGRVVFTVEDALTPNAKPGKGTTLQEENNVYEWFRGRVSLLTSGQVKVVDMAGPNGRDIFVKTYSQLVPQDFDFAADVYDFRAGGGFPAAAAAPPPCDPAADQCQGAPSGSPAGTTPGSSQFVGPGNPAPPEPGKKPKKKQKKKHKKQAKKHRKNKKQDRHGSAGKQAKPAINGKAGGAK